MENVAGQSDRLGDLYYELGRFDRAADCWLDVLRERSDTDLSPALLSVKAALALSHANRQSELEQIRTDLRQRYADEKFDIARIAAQFEEIFAGLPEV